MFCCCGPVDLKFADSLLDSALSLSIFRRMLKTHFFAKYRRAVLSALEIFYENALYKFTIYLLTQLLTGVKPCLIRLSTTTIKRADCTFKPESRFVLVLDICPPLPYHILLLLQCTHYHQLLSQHRNWFKISTTYNYMVEGPA